MGNFSRIRLVLIAVLVMTCAAGAANAQSRPSADFRWYSSDDLTVFFDDLSEGQVDSLDWDFGDNTSSTEQDPTHVYEEPGLYNVTLRATNTFGFSETTYQVTITGRESENLPNADFDWTTDGLTVSFRDRSWGAIDSWNWNFGDDGSSTERDPVHTFASTGSYQVVLTVTNQTGSSERTLQVNVSGGDGGAPDASFTWTSDRLTAIFQDQSSGYVTSWSWDFWDGHISSRRNPVHTYAEAGTYYVTLTVSSTAGSSTYTAPVTVQASGGEAPRAQFRWTADGLTAAFEDLSTGDVDSWFWEFGDGSVSETSDPVHTYLTAGTYDVRLSVSNIWGVSSRTRAVTVEEDSSLAPEASLAWRADGLLVQFEDRSTGQIDSWLWSFGDGTTSSQRDPQHLYDRAGVYDVNLTVANQWGASEYNSRVILPSDEEAPEADFAFAVDDRTVVFENLTSPEADRNLWNFDDGNGSLSYAPTYTYTSPGTYLVELWAENEAGSSAVTKRIVIQEDTGNSPEADFEWTTFGLWVYFQDDSTGEVDWWEWDFGDGSTSDMPDPLHQYAAAGTYRVELTVGNRWDSTSKAYQVIVEEEDGDPPIADFSWSAAGLTADFEDESIGEIDEWAWDFGDDTTSTESDPTHTYEEAGTYDVQLVVSNSYGFTAITREVTVGEPEPDEYIQIIAGVGYSRGAEGSFWATQVEINNRGAQLMSYEIWWLPRGQNNIDPVSSGRFTLGAGQSMRYDNVLAEVFNLDPDDGPFGSIAISSDREQFVSAARIYNQPLEGGGGTVGQSMPGVPYEGLIGDGEQQRIILLTEDSEFRSNIGCQNGFPRTVTIVLQLRREDGTSLGETSINLAPYSSQQINRILAPYSPIDGYVDVYSPTPGGRFFCYGSVLDNTTSDPTTVLTK